MRISRKSYVVYAGLVLAIVFSIYMVKKWRQATCSGPINPHCIIDRYAFDDQWTVLLPLLSPLHGRWDFTYQSNIGEPWWTANATTIWDTSVENCHTTIVDHCKRSGWAPISDGWKMDNSIITFRCEVIDSMRTKVTFDFFVAE